MQERLGSVDWITYRRSLVTHGKEVIAVSILLPFVAVLICNDVIRGIRRVRRLHQAFRLTQEDEPVPEGLLTEVFK